MNSIALASRSFIKTLSVLSATIALSFALALMPAPAKASSSLTSQQISAIVSLLQAFNADPSVIANVQANLSGQATTAPSATINQSSLSTNSVSPTLSGTAANTSVIDVSITSTSGVVMYANYVSVSGGLWTVTVPTIFTSGTYTVYVRDANNNVLTSGTLSINTNNPTSTAPTATLAVNGFPSATVNVGDIPSYVWTSTNGTSYSSTYSVDLPTCAAGTGPFAWIANGPNGLSNTTPVAACAAGHTYTITYTVTNTVGQTATASVTVKVNAAAAPSPTATLTTPSFTTTSLNPTITGAATNTTGVNIVVDDSTGRQVWYNPSLPIPVNNAGQWSVTISATLPVGTYTVYVTDLNSNKLTSGGLTVLPVTSISVSNAPSATLTVNGLSNTTATVGSVPNYQWSASNAASFASTYTTDSPACGATGTGPYAWVANSASGSSNTVAILPCQAGHTYTITYTAGSYGNGSASAVAVLKINAPINALPTSSATIDASALSAPASTPIIAGVTITGTAANTNTVNVTVNGTLYSSVPVTNGDWSVKAFPASRTTPVSIVVTDPVTNAQLTTGSLVWNTTVSLGTMGATLMAAVADSITLPFSLLTDTLSDIFFSLGVH